MTFGRGNLGADTNDRHEALPLAALKVLKVLNFSRVLAERFWTASFANTDAKVLKVKPFAH